MVRFIVYVLILLAAIWLGLQIKTDPGYVLFSYADWTMEMPLWFAVVAFIIIFFVLYWSLRFLSNLIAMNSRVRAWLGLRRQRRSHSNTSRGLIDFAEGQWHSAERYLSKGASSSETPLINFLAAARAAQEQGAYDRRDDYLRKAHGQTPEAEIAIGLTQAQLQINAQQLEQGLATLRHLRRIEPNHAYVLKLLAQLYVELKDWQSLVDLLPELRKRKVIKKAKKLLKLERLAYSGLFENTELQSADRIHELYKQLPRHLKYDPVIVLAFSKILLKKDCADEVENLLKESIKREWDEALIELYGKTPSSAIERQVATAESWLKSEGNSATLLLCLGRLCIRNKLWGKARSYLEDCIRIQPSPQAYHALGKLLEQLNENETAADQYRHGLEVCTGHS